MAFKVGDKVRVVKYSEAQNGIEGEVVGLDGWRFSVGGQGLRVQLTKPSGKVHGGKVGQVLFYKGEEVEPLTEAKEDVKMPNTTGAMGREQALTQAKRLAELGLKTKLVTRSWDETARFFAVDTVETEPQHFVNVRQVDDFIKNQQPIDVEPYYIAGEHFYFRTPQGDTIPTQARVGLSWWTEDMIRATGGVAVHNGRRYRFLRKVTRVEPFVDNDGK